MLWEVDIYPLPGQPDRTAHTVAAQAAQLNIVSDLKLACARGYLIQGDFDRSAIQRAAHGLLVDTVVERAVVAPLGDRALVEPPAGLPQLIHVLPKPGVMDPVAQSTQQALANLGLHAGAVRTLQKYWLPPLAEGQWRTLAAKVLANDAIEQVIAGPLPFDHIELGSPYRFERLTVAVRDLDDAALAHLSRHGQLYLSLSEMQTIRAYFRDLGRDPTDAELESIAQTWSEHCSHKTLAGRIAYRDENGPRQFDNMLKETIFAATVEIRRRLGAGDWCVSVFSDNAGIIRFDDHYNVAFKVETHNHPSALEPYGGANTGMGGVIRDTLGTGLGAKPICNTDVFCFAPPDTPAERLPEGVLHPRRVIQGVVAGVRDYGNRMGIPTVNGAIYFDERYLGNPLVYCGNVGLIPRDKSFKQPQPGDHIVALGGRTGRDGIHGATFSSAELTSQSESLSGGAVQIGNAITEKMVLDVLLAARDRGLYNAVTDCGAGGFSSAVGEMGEEIGAEVWLDKAPVKYDGLSYTEIWISEAQERMVLAVPPESWPELLALCESEGVEATIIGRFVPTGRLALKFGQHEVANLDMQFLHRGRPAVVREAVYQPAPSRPLTWPAAPLAPSVALERILGSLNVASKHWVVRQYDHEVQGGSVIKPFVGVANDGPGDAAVVRPVLESRRGLVIGCGMNPHYGDFDTRHMAASAIDEALRNCVAVGADPGRIAILDNFCWGNTDRAETLGSLVRAALACQEMAIALGTPFISGKDSLNNEFRHTGPDGRQQSIAIPPSLLISALGQVDDVAHCVTMDLKEPGNLLFIVGQTKEELGGSHFALVGGCSGGEVPKVDAAIAARTFAAVHQAIAAGTVRACHDLSEGGLGVALAEMAFAGGLGARVALLHVPCDIQLVMSPDGDLSGQAGEVVVDESGQTTIRLPDGEGLIQRHEVHVSNVDNPRVTPGDEVVRRDLILDAINRRYSQLDDQSAESMLQEFIDETSPPIVRLVYLLISEAVQLRASEIHLEPIEDRIRIRYRIDGTLVERDSPPLRLLGPLVSRIKILAKMDLAQRQRPQDGRIEMAAGDKSVSLAVRVIPTTHGESVFMKLLSEADAKDEKRSSPTPLQRTDAAAGLAEIESGPRRSRFDTVLLFSESNTRFLCEVPPAAAGEFSRLLAGVPHAKIGVVRADSRLEVIGIDGAKCLTADIAQLKAVWQKPLDW